MGQKNSKDEMVYQQVIEGNVEAIKALCNEGARLEWIDKEGKTPLIVACMDARLYIVAKTLIELGANINAYRPGAHAGTPLHHAAKRGLEYTVKLLLSCGANPFARNDDCQSPLDVARTKGYITVVRAIEAHVSFYSGEVREMVVPRIIGSLMPQSLARKSSKKCYVVVVPYDSPSSKKPPKFEFAVYSSSQDAQPHTVIRLWKSIITEPKFHELDPFFTIFDESTKTRYKFLSAIEGDRQQLVQLYSACKGAPKVFPSSEVLSTGISSSQPVVNTSNQPESTSISNSQASTATNGWGDIVGNSTHSDGGSCHGPPSSKSTYNGWADTPKAEECNGWADPGPSRSNASHTTVTPPPVPSTPSAPPLPTDSLDGGPIHYPAVEMGPLDSPVSSGGPNDKNEESYCVVCWEARVEGACVPCGHMAGCMSCLSEIKSKRGDCPVCRAKIDQVIRLYAV